MATPRSRLSAARHLLGCVLAGALAGTAAADADRCGDVDLDGALTVLDAAHVGRAAIGLPSGCTPAVCDIDDDGLVTATDARLAAAKAVGLPILEGCGPARLSGTLVVPERLDLRAPATEREPNDVAGAAQVLGLLEVGATARVRGATAAGDPFDGYRLLVAAPATLELDLIFTARAEAPGDLDLLVLDTDRALSCESAADTSERCAVRLGGRRVRALDVVVFPAAASGAATYTLTAHTRAGSGAAPALGAGAGAGPPLDVAVAAYRGVEADFVPGEVVAQAVAPAADPAAALAALAADATGTGPRLEPITIDPTGLALLRVGAAREPTREAARAGRPEAPERKLERAALRLETRAAAATLADLPAIAWAHPNYLGRPARVPSDPLFPEQWHHRLIDLPRAWDITVGAERTIVAVIDTGVRSDHPDLQGRLVPGFDFIADPARANDGDGLDPDPTDPGDLPGTPLLGTFHGTHVAGTIAAASDNAVGVTGVTWRAGVMPLRALGVGGGALFDIAQAIRFAAGLPNVTGTVPPEPAHVLNLSLVFLGDSPALRAAVDAATAAGALVVAAAGNTASDVPIVPADYPNSLAVAAVDRLGEPAIYSSFGPRVDLAAPGGDVHRDLDGDGFTDGVLSTLAGGARAYGRYQGTSMAAAHVSGVAALLLAADPTLRAADLRRILTASSRDRGAPGPDPHFGAGLLDARAAVRQAAGVTPGGGPEVVLDAESLDFDRERTELRVHAANAGGGRLALVAASATTDDGRPWLGAALDPDPLSVVVRVARSGLPPGTYTGAVDVASSGGDATIGVEMQVAPAPADTGTILVRLIDPATRAIRATVTTDAAQTFHYDFGAVPPGRYEIFAGTDRDGDGAICGFGELCGAFPVLARPEVVAAAGGTARADLDFALTLIAREEAGAGARAVAGPGGFSARAGLTCLSGLC